MYQNDPQIQKALLQIQAAKAFYNHCRELTESAWRFHSYYVDFDPREVDPNATQEEIESFQSQCNLFFAMANIKEMEKATAYRDLQKAYKHYYELEEIHNEIK